MATPLSPLLLPGQIDDDDLRQHFRALGVGTVAAYKLWCYRHGLSTDLHKTPDQRSIERALFESLHDLPEPGRPYLLLLRESARILRLWMDREGLTHG